MAARHAQSRPHSSLLTALAITACFLLLSMGWFWPVTVGEQTILPADNLHQYEPFRSQAAEFGVERPHNPLLSDLVLQNLPWREHIRQSLSAGEWPMWNPHQFAGTPFLAKGQHLALYPLSMVFLLLPLWKAYGVFIALHLALAGLFAFVLARSLGLRPFEALVTGITYGFSGFVVANAVFPMILVAVAWLPLLMAAMVRLSPGDKTSHRLTVSWIVSGVLALGMIALAGHPEMLYYSLLTAGLFGLWRWLSLPADIPRGTSLAALAGVLGLGLMLGAVQLMPQFAVVSESFRAGTSTLAEVRSYALPWHQAVAFLLPDFFGNPTHGHFRAAIGGETMVAEQPVTWGRKNFVEGAVYVGILPLLLAAAALAGLCRRRQRAVDDPASPALFAVLLLFALAFAFGTPLYALVYLLPGMEQVHSPFRWMLIATLGLAVLAGYGVRMLADLPARAGDFNAGIARRLALTAIAVGLGLLFLLLASRAFYPSMAPLLDMVFRSMATARQVIPSVDGFYSYQLAGLLRLSMLALGSGVVIELARRRLVLPLLPRSVPLWQPALVAVLVIDLFLFARGLFPHNDPVLLDSRPPVIDMLAAGSPPARFTTFDPADRKTLNANAGWRFGLHDLRGYDSIFAADYARVMALIGEQDQLRYNRIAPLRSPDALDSPLLDMFNVRYVLTEEWIDSPRWRRVADSGTLRVYENAEVLPRAWLMAQTATVSADDPVVAMLEFDPRFHVIVETDRAPEADSPLAAGTPMAATITSYRNNRIQIEVETEQPAWLVLADSFDSGWRARAVELKNDALELAPEVHRVNGMLRGVLLEPGHWQVDFRYRSPGLVAGLLLSLAALIALVVLALSAWIPRRGSMP